MDAPTGTAVKRGSGGSVSKLWAVTSGEYSDYSVDGIFETEEDARAAVRLGYGEDVKPIDFFRAGDAPVKRLVWYARSGPITPEGVVANGWDREARQEVTWKAASAQLDRPEVEQDREGDRIWIYVEAPTKELAEKVLHDRIAQARAELLGL